MQHLTLRHWDRIIPGFYVTEFFFKLRDALAEKYPDIVFENEVDMSYENKGYGSICSPMSSSILNKENGKYIVISFFDNWKYHFMKHLGWEPKKMIQFLYPGGFNYIDYFNYKKESKNNRDVEFPDDILSVYRSFFYGPHGSGDLDLIDKLYKKRNIEKTIDKLMFRGWLWDFRKDMAKGLENDPSIQIIERRDGGNQLGYREYLEDMAKYKCALSFPGGTEVCNRDIECFGIGVPVMRPYLNIEYPVTLVPNYHYISCYMDCKYWSGYPSYLNYKEFSEYVIDYWHRVRTNHEFLDFISVNAREWYANNCTIDKSVEYVLNQLKMEELYG